MDDNTMNKKLLEMYKNNPEFFYKKMIDTLTEMNLEYQIEIFLLLEVVIKIISDEKFTEQDDISAGMLVEKIMKNHDLKNVEELIKKRQISIDAMTVRTLAGLVPLGGVQ